MIKKTLCICLAFLLVITLTGCWDYGRLNELTIVSGVAIDLDQASGDYQLAFEIFDLGASTKDTGVESMIIDTSGKTIFEAVRNAKKKLSNQLYFGAAQIVVINDTIARQDGINSIIDILLRDTEVRETIDIIVSQEKSARDILSSDYTDNKIISFQVYSTIEEDNLDTLSTEDVKLYQIFNILKSKGLYLVLPAFKNSKEGEKTITESNGLALFEKDKLIGYLSPEETKFYLFAVNKVKGGILAFENIDSDIKKLSLEIETSKTKFSYSYEDNQIKMVIEPTIDVYLGEIVGAVKDLKDKQFEKIQETAENQLAKEMEDTVKKVQTEYRTDIFGFGNYIYKNDLKLWKKISLNWNELFVNMEIEVKPKITIKSSSLIR